MHSGIGIRRLTKTFCGCRVGRDDRLAFEFIATPLELVFFFPGNPEEIQSGFARTLIPFPVLFPEDARHRDSRATGDTRMQPDAEHFCM